MSQARVLAVFTTVLGNASFARKLKHALDRIPEIEPVYVLVGAEDYTEYPAPKWARLSDPWEGRYVARQKAKAVTGQDFDLLLVSSWEFVVEFRHLARRIRAAAFMDSVPSTLDAQLRRRGQDNWKRHVAGTLHHRAFKSAAPHFKYFFTWGSDAADALYRDYGVDRDRTVVTLIPQDLDVWKPGTGESGSPLRLLFVGNDFLRKGGDFLLRLFAAHLTNFCRLTIASNDTFLEGCRLPEGVEWLRGRSQEQLIDVLQGSDLFVFPTRQDFAATNAVCEALACGVPCIASDVGGIADVVWDDLTGFLMPFDAPAEAWADVIRNLNSDRAKLARLATGARSFAEEKLSPERFRDNIRSVIQRLVA